MGKMTQKNLAKKKARKKKKNKEKLVSVVNRDKKNLGIPEPSNEVLKRRTKHIKIVRESLNRKYNDLDRLEGRGPILLDFTGELIYTMPLDVVDFYEAEIEYGPLAEIEKRGKKKIIAADGKKKKRGNFMEMCYYVWLGARKYGISTEQRKRRKWREDCQSFDFFIRRCGYGEQLLIVTAYMKLIEVSTVEVNTIDGETPEKNSEGGSVEPA